MKISELFGKKVNGTAGKSGYVLSVFANGNKLEYLVCADENEREFTIDYKNIKSVRESVTFEEAESQYAAARPLRLGRPVFDCEGLYLGKLTEITCDKNAVTSAHVGNKKFSAEDVVCGDAVIVKNSARIIKSDVKKNGKILFRRGTPLTGEVLKKAQKQGEYVQTNLKTI